MLFNATFFFFFGNLGETHAKTNEELVHKGEEGC